MKRLLLLLSLLAVPLANIHAQIEAKVDERFELTGILLSLADFPEFTQCGVESYKQDIDDYFARFKSSEQVQSVKELCRQLETQKVFPTPDAKLIFSPGDILMPAAGLLEIKNGHVRLSREYKGKDLSRLLPPEWTAEQFGEYVKILDGFYRESRFGRFFKEHEGLYAEAENNVKEVYDEATSDWFVSFFGDGSVPGLRLYVSLVNCHYSYLVGNAMLIPVNDDKDGNPVPYKNVIWGDIDDMCREFSENIFYRYWNEMEPAANIIYPQVEGFMKENGFNDAEAAFREWFNRLCAMMYFRENGDEFYEAYLYIAYKTGFLWMERAAEFMGNFVSHRDLYPHIEDFMPQIVDFLDFTADDFSYVLEEYASVTPYITNIFVSGSGNLADADEIILSFSEPMQGSYGFDGVPEGVEELPFEKVEWLDGTHFRFVLTEGACRPGHTYGIILSPEGFLSPKMFSVDEKHRVLRFKCE